MFILLVFTKHMYLWHKKKAGKAVLCAGFMASLKFNCFVDSFLFLAIETVCFLLLVAFFINTLFLPLIDI